MCHLAAHKTCCVVETICYIPTFTNIGIKQLKFIVKLLLNFVMEAQNNSFHMGLFNKVTVMNLPVKMLHQDIFLGPIQ